MAEVTKKKIEQLARALFPRYGIKDVASLVSTIVKYRSNDGHVKIWRPEGGWSWFASPGTTVATPSMVALKFPADYRRTAAMARDDLYRQLEDASLSVMSEDEIEAALRAKPGAAASTAPSAPKKTPAQLDREIAEVLAAPKTNLGQARADRLADALRGLGHEAEAFRQYGRNSVGVHRVGPSTAGTWRQIVSFTDEGSLVPFAGGGRGNPWRHGAEHRAVEETASWRP